MNRDIVRNSIVPLFEIIYKKNRGRNNSFISYRFTDSGIKARPILLWQTSMIVDSN